MATQTLKNEQAEQFLRELIAARLIDDNEKENILYMERMEGHEFTAQELAAAFLDEDAELRLKPSQIVDYNTIRANAGLVEVAEADVPTEEEPDTPWYRDPGQLALTTAIGPLGFAWRAGAAAGIDVGDMDLGGIPRKIAEGMAGGADKLAASKYDSAARQRIITNLEAKGFEVERHMILGEQSPDYEELKVYLAETYNLSPQEVNNLVQDGQNSGLAAYNDHMGLTEELATIAAEADALEADEAGLKRREAFELLDDATPGKYAWNSETQQIHETVTGHQVDMQGQIDVDAYASETGTWAEAAGTAPWIGLGLGNDTVFDDTVGGAEDNYYRLYDVVVHPDQYGADPSRYLPGSPGFLGGFSSEFHVPTSGLDSTMRQSDDALAGFAAGDDWSQTYRNITQVSQREYNARPFYETNDDWALFAGQSREAIAEMQNTLVGVGALEAGDIVQGSWGPAEAAAFKDWLFIANGQARRWEDVDTDLMKNYFGEKNASAGKPARTPFVSRAYQRMDPATAENSVKSVVRNMLGRDPTSDELGQLGSYLEEQHRGSFVADVEAARSEYNATTAAIDSGQEQSGGEVQDVDFEARFIKQFEDTHEAELARSKRTETSVNRQETVGQGLSNLMNKLGGGF